VKGLLCVTTSSLNQFMRGRSSSEDVWLCVESPRSTFPFNLIFCVPLLCDSAHRELSLLIFPLDFRQGEAVRGLSRAIK
jgi:hypothetical protein